MGEIKSDDKARTSCNGVEQTKVYFLKVHKTGSTTVRNILQRFALERNLTMPMTLHQHTYPLADITKYLIPLHSYWREYQHIRGQGSMNYIESKSRLLEISGETKARENQCDVFAVHSVFKKQEILKLFPPEVVFVATMRHPLQQMMSAFHMWKLAHKFYLNNYTDPVKKFLSDPMKYDKILPASMYNVISKTEQLKLSYTKNYVAYEFGFDLERVSNQNYVDDYLRDINESFDVILFTERFPESLILLKRKMCWTFKDIIYIHLRNAHIPQKTYSTKLLENHRQWSNVDYLIYNMFLERHKYFVKRGGKEFQKELKIFEGILNDVHSFCLHMSRIIYDNNTSSFFHDAAQKEVVIGGSDVNEGFTVSGADCVIMSLNEAHLYVSTRVHRYPQLCDVGFVEFLKYMGYKKDTSMFCGENPMKYNIPYKMMSRAFWMT